MLSDRDVTEAVTSPWKGKNYSQRIWKNTQKLADEAGKIIDAGITAGQSYDKIAREIADLMDVGFYAASRLVRTEGARIYNNATLQGYKDMDVEWYSWLGTLDARTCESCGSKDGQHFKVSEAKTGVNLPPLHPNCRCTTIAYYPEDEKNPNAQRIARDPETGRNYKAPAGMDYKKWRETIAQKYGENALAVARAKYYNRDADDAEYRPMRKMLGKDAPETFAKYQDLKYNEPEKWHKIRLDERRRERLVQHPEQVLPRASGSIIEEPKFTKYFFGGTNQKGLSKGVAFTSHLGYDAGNWEQFRAEISERAKLNPARFTHENEHGKYYNQAMIVYGVKENPMDIMASWELKDDKLRFVTAFPNNKGET